MNDTSKLVWHYTSLDTLFKILEGIKSDDNGKVFSLYATHFAFLNDMQEGQMIPNVMKELFREADTDSYFFDFAQSIVDDSFIVSLSKKEDNLNQWRAYGDDGKGVSIGLNREGLCSLFKNSNNVRCYDCNYLNEGEVKNSIKNSVQYKEYLDCPNPTSLQDLLLESMKYKHYSFKEEEEFRIEVKRSTNIGYRIKNDFHIPFYDLRLNIDLIESIYLGPKCNEKHFYYVKHLLFDKNTNVSYKKSVIPYI